MTTVVNMSEPGENELPPPQPQIQLEPTLSRAQIKQSDLLTGGLVPLIEQLYVMTVKQHLLKDTPRDEWKPPAGVLVLLSTYYNKKVAESLAFMSGDHLDSQIQEIADLGEEIGTSVQDLTERDLKLTSAETGLVYTEDKAVYQVESNQAKIDADTRRGCSHHQRVPRWFRWLGKIMPFGEALGLLVLLSYWLNVEWTRPSQDPLTWTLSVVIVLATLLFTPRVVERSGEAWNRRREAVAENRIEARRSATRKVLVNGAIAAAVSLAIVAGLVERALAVTDDTIPESMLALLIALCVIAGLAMPALALFAKAWDGSSLSRENDSLAKQLGGGLEEHQQLQSEVASRNRECEQIELAVHSEAAPIRRVAYDAADEMREVYAFLLVQLGVDSDLGVRTTAKPIGDEAELIWTGIPGADPIRLEPLASRELRLQELRRHRKEAISSLNALQAHPWAGNNNPVRTTS